MPSQREALRQLEAAARRELDAVAEIDALQAWRVAYLGRRGRLTQVLRSLAQLPLEDRRAIGGAANELKTRLAAACPQPVAPPPPRKPPGPGPSGVAPWTPSRPARPCPAAAFPPLPRPCAISWPRGR